MSNLAAKVTEAFPLAQGGFPSPELDFMCDTVAMFRPTFIAEWGTNSGCSARIFWECCRLLDLRTEIHTVELPDELQVFDDQHPGVNCGLYIARESGVVQHRGDGVTEALILYKRLQPERPLFFLDGDHSQVMVYREIALIDRMTGGAPMLIHDTNGAGPGDAARKWVSEFDYTFREIPDRVGIGLLERAL